MTRKLAGKISSRRVGALAITTALVGSALTALSAPTASAQDQLTWGACPAGVFTAPDAVCAEFQVPKDYANPAGEQITLTMSKIPAVGQSKGVIAGNPGGPGGEALGMFAGNTGEDEFIDSRVSLPDNVRRNYDQIAVEPRGLAFGEPLTCEIAGFPTTALQLPVPGWTRDLCNIAQPGLIDTVTTENTARDLNEARKVLGQDKLNLYGLSYGGLLMGTYATLFPQHTGKTLMDSPASPDMQWFDLGAERNQARHDSLEAMFQWIADHNDEYGLGTTPLQVYQRWAQRINEETGVAAAVTPPPAQLGDLPAGLQQQAGVALPAVNSALPPMWRLYSAFSTLVSLAPGATATAPTYQYTVGVGLYQQSSWPKVAELIRDGELDEPIPELPEDEEILEDIAKQSLTYGPVERAIICNENKNQVRPEKILPNIVDTWTGGDQIGVNEDAFTSGQFCAGWPLPTPAMALTGEGLETKPLHIGFTNDSAVTPRGASDMQRAMGGELVLVEGHSHGVLVNDRDAVAEKVNSYFGV